MRKFFALLISVLLFATPVFAGTNTANYSLVKPDVNNPDDQDLWGAELNTDLDTIDATMFSISTVANAAATSDANLLFSDITTNNASTSKHGFMPKLDGNAGHCVLGDGTIGVCPGGGGGGVTSVAGRTGAVSLTNNDISGLGTAATLNVGTAANNIVQLGSDGKLPAIDGSKLTGLSTPNVTNTSAGKVVMGAITIQWGRGNCGQGGSGNNFGSAFSTTPYSVVYARISATGQNDLSLGNISSSGFSCISGGASPQIYWQAIGPT